MQNTTFLSWRFEWRVLYMSELKDAIAVCPKISLAAHACKELKAREMEQILDGNITTKWE